MDDNTKRVIKTLKAKRKALRNNVMDSREEVHKLMLAATDLEKVWKVLCAQVDERRVYEIRSKELKKQIERIYAGEDPTYVLLSS